VNPWAKQKGEIMTTFGNNVAVEEKGNVITITVDKTQDFGPSNSGKTHQIASTLGNQKFGDVFIGVNVYKKAA
jgi:hypothetical protein